MRRWIITALVLVLSVWIWAQERGPRGGGGGGRGGGSGRSGTTTTTTSAPTTLPKVAQWKPAEYPKDEVHLLAYGDWGTNEREQKYVAESLAEYVARDVKKQFHGVLLVGDNFYTRLRNGAKDMQWQTLFEDMYDAKRLNMPFYAIAGNHDWEDGDVFAQIEYAKRNPTSRWKYPGNYYRLDFPEENPLVTVFMVDSNRPRIKPEEWSRQMSWIDQELSKPRRSRWTMICAHHELFSNGPHGDIGLMQLEWGPILQKHRVDFYVNGHEHSLQHLEIPGWSTSFIVTGGGGKSGTMMVRERGPFSRCAYGFVHFHFTKERAKVYFLDGSDTRQLHSFYRKPGGAIEIIESLGVDRAWKGQKPSKEFEGSDRTAMVGSTDPIPPKKEEKKDHKKPETKPSEVARDKNGELLKSTNNGTGN